MNIKPIIAIIFLLLITKIFSQSDQGLKKFLDEYNVKGSFLLYDMNNDNYVIFDSARCSVRFTPASTFKIANSIIGLETGVIPDENFVIPWDSVKRNIEAWNHDLDMKTAIKVSAVPYYQKLAGLVGEKRMQEFITKLGYGNMDISGGIDQFWLNGKLRISQFEQIKFLVKLYNDSLPVSKRTMGIVKSIILLEDTLRYKLRAKTGWGNQENVDIGWFVGWIEKNDNVYFFATNIESENPDDNFAAARIKITKNILHKYEIY